MYAVFGALIAFAIYRFIPVSIWRTKWLWAALALLVVVILLTALVGVDNYGAKRWAAPRSCDDPSLRVREDRVRFGLCAHLHRFRFGGD